MKEYEKWQNFKITEQERQHLKKDAHKHEMNISEYLRWLIDMYQARVTYKTKED